MMKINSVQLLDGHLYLTGLPSASGGVSVQVIPMEAFANWGLLLGFRTLIDTAIAIVNMNALGVEPNWPALFEEIRRDGDAVVVGPEQAKAQALCGKVAGQPMKLIDGITVAALADIRAIFLTKVVELAAIREAGVKMIKPTVDPGSLLYQDPNAPSKG